MGRYRIIAVTALLAAAAMSGCGSDATPTAGALPAGQMVFMVRQYGGMVPAVISAMQSPSLAVFGDGRVLTSQKDSALQPLPARYAVADVGAEAVRAFVADVRSGGLLNGATDFGSPRVTDVSTTEVMVQDASGRAEARVYALSARFDDALSPAQRDARSRLRALIEQAGALATGAPTADYVPERILVSEPLPGRNTETAVTAWPGPPPSGFLAPADGGRVIACGELTGADAGTVYQAALNNPGALWLVDGVTRVLAVNPLPVGASCDG